MKILIKNAGNTFNYGSMMMAENLISFLNTKIKGIDFFIEANQSSNIERLKEATQYESIHSDTVLSIKLLTKNIKYVRIVEKMLRRKRHLFKAAKFYDAIIILGGDDFSEIYYSFPKDNIAIKLVFEELEIFAQKSKLLMIGQTIGPYSGKRISLAKKAFENANIYSRDKETAEYMQKTFDLKINTSKDLAFLDLKMQKAYLKKYKKLLSQYHLIENEYITVVGSGLINKYAVNENDFIDGFYKMIKILKEKYPSKKIVCLAHVFAESEKGDNTLYKKINKKYDHYLKDNCVMIDNPLLPVEARMILGFGYFTITCRMHAAVSTFQMGKPAICISYSKKYDGVIGEGLKMSELILDATKEDFWNHFEKSINDEIDYVEKNRSKLIDKIKVNVLKCQDEVIETLNKIVNDLDKER